MSAYSRGMHLERRVADSLESDGYFVVPSKGSKGPADLVALKANDYLFVQVKIGSRFDTADWNELYDLSEKCGATAVFVHRAGRELMWWRLAGPKVPGSRVRPWVPWHADEVAA